MVHAATRRRSSSQANCSEHLRRACSGHDVGLVPDSDRHEVQGRAASPHSASVERTRVGDQCAVNDVSKDKTGKTLSNGGHNGRPSCSMDVMLWTASLLLYTISSTQMWTGRARAARSSVLVRATSPSAWQGWVRTSTATNALPSGARAFEVLELWTAQLLEEISQWPEHFRTKVLDKLTKMGSKRMRRATGHYDVILLSELVGLGEELRAELLQTFRRLLGPNTVASPLAVDHDAFPWGFCGCSRSVPAGFGRGVSLSLGPARSGRGRVVFSSRSHSTEALPGRRWAGVMVSTMACGRDMTLASIGIHSFTETVLDSSGAAPT